MESKGDSNLLSNQEEPFYDTAEIASPTYDNAGSPDFPSSPIYENPEDQKRQEDEWRKDLQKLEEEILTLRQVLGAKVQQANALKHKLGITPLQELKHDLQHGIQNIRESPAYQKTSTGFKSAGEKTGAALNAIGCFTKTKLDDVKNSPSFRSFEERVQGAYTNVKAKVTGSKSENNFEEVLNNTANENASSGSDSTLPENKVPL